MILFGGALILLAAMVYTWVRLTLGARHFGHRYFFMYLAFMAPFTYFAHQQHMQTLFTLILLQIFSMTVWKVARLLCGD